MNKFKKIIKNNFIFYKIYSFIFGFLINICKAFIRVDEKTILFNCFGGKKFDDSPKAIFDYIIRNKKYVNYNGNSAKKIYNLIEE